MSASSRPAQGFRPVARLLLAGGLVGLALAGARPALAKEAAVSPLVHKKDVDPMVVLNLTSLISSEADFLSAFDGVDQIEQMPEGMNGACLSSPSCLGKVAKAAGADALIAGAVSQAGSKYDFYLVYYDGGRIVRTREFSLPTVPSVIADSMGGYVKELVTGQSLAREAQEDSKIEAVADADIFADEGDDDFDIDFSDDDTVSRRIPTPGASGGGEDLGDDLFDEDPEADRRAAEEEARRAAEEEARRKAEEEARRRAAEEEARRKAEEEARRRAAEEEARRKAEARRRAEEEARRRAEEEAAAQEDDIDVDDLQFGSAADEIQVEDLTFKPATTAIVVEDDSADGGADDSDDDLFADDFDFGSDDTADDLDSLDDDAGRSSRSSTSRSSRSSRYDDLERERETTRSSRSSRSSASRSSRSSRYDDLDEADTVSRARKERDSRSSGSADDVKATVTTRIGASRFQELSFITYGGEAVFVPTPGLGIVVGVEAYSTRREVPEVLLPEGTEGIYQWNTILPFNLGMVYRMGSGSVRPYVGADAQFIPGYVKDAGGVAVGMRARGGSDFMVAERFGFNLNLSAGFWSGQNFETVQREFDRSAMVPQISGGTVFTF